MSKESCSCATSAVSRQGVSAHLKHLAEGIRLKSSSSSSSPGNIVTLKDDLQRVVMLEGTIGGLGLSVPERDGMTTIIHMASMLPIFDTYANAREVLALLLYHSGVDWTAKTLGFQNRDHHQMVEKAVLAVGSSSGEMGLEDARRLIDWTANKKLPGLTAPCGCTNGRGKAGSSGKGRPRAAQDDAGAQAGGGRGKGRPRAAQDDAGAQAGGGRGKGRPRAAQDDAGAQAGGGRGPKRAAPKAEPVVDSSELRARFKRLGRAVVALQQQRPGPSKDELAELTTAVQNAHELPRERDRAKAFKHAEVLLAGLQKQYSVDTSLRALHPESTQARKSGCIEYKVATPWRPPFLANNSNDMQCDITNVASVRLFREAHAGRWRVATSSRGNNDLWPHAPSTRSEGLAYARFMVAMSMFYGRDHTPTLDKSACAVVSRWSEGAIKNELTTTFEFNPLGQELKVCHGLIRKDEGIESATRGQWLWRLKQSQTGELARGTAATRTQAAQACLFEAVRCAFPDGASFDWSQAIVV